MYNINDENIIKNFNNLNEDKEITFLLVGTNKSKDKYSKYNKNDSEKGRNIIQIITEKYQERSGLIDYENMKKIKTLLSIREIISDEIIYPNEIY